LDKNKCLELLNGTMKKKKKTLKINLWGSLRRYPLMDKS
jgi:hypothetical protein